MSGLHGTLGWLTVGAAVVVTVVAFATWLLQSRRPVRALAVATNLIVAAVTVVIVATIFVGGLLIITGTRPDDVGHIVIGVMALAVLPASLGLGALTDQDSDRPPRRSLWVAGGGVVLTVLALLLTVTG
jgi:hypothetical protein